MGYQHSSPLLMLAVHPKTRLIPLLIAICLCSVSTRAEQPSESSNLQILKSSNFQIFKSSNLKLDDIILDIYNAASEFSETDFEQLQSDLYALHDTPIDLNNTTEEELTQLRFLTPQQIDELLSYADKHPFVSLYELRLIPSLKDYDIRDLLPFVTIKSSNPQIVKSSNPQITNLHPSHELITRVDARNIEGYSGTDPMYIQTRYRLDCNRRITFGAQLRRPAGGDARSLQYGAYIRLKDITPHLHTVVGGNFQASFGQGLVLAPIFHAGKTMYISSVGQQTNGLRYYSSVDGNGLHGAGTTLRWQFTPQTRLDASLLYSMRRANDSTWHHLIGANLTLRHQRLELQLTAIENLYSDSIHPYRDAAYNQHYFRGRNQAVIGTSFRYNHGWFDLFGELATAQNYTSPSLERVKSSARSDAQWSSVEQLGESFSHWGFATIVGSRFYPVSGVTLLALYRYYSPYFDNTLGYAFSETSRIGDENGGYIGFDITRFRHWRLLGYGDIFYFTGPKYGIPTSPTLGYDAAFETQYIRSVYRLSARLRARKKDLSLYSARLQADVTHGSWTFRTTADLNFTNPQIPNPQIIKSSNPQISYGLSLAQDFSYSLPLWGEELCSIERPVDGRRTNLGRGFSFHFRLQFFDAREWNNRIYLYEHDVLYSFSIPATYGLGGRAYLCLKWQIIPSLALYFKASETVYSPSWAASHDRSVTRTDLHLLLRAKF